MSSSVRFNELEECEWFFWRGELWQKLGNLNGSNAYRAGRFVRSGFGYIGPREEVERTYAPRHGDAWRGRDIVLHVDGTWSEATGK